VYEVKITVLKCLAHPDLVEEYMGNAVKPERLEDPRCGVFEEGQVFVLPDASVIPDGFCAWAWADIHREILAISSGGNLDPWLKRPGLAIACCTDGFRPVVFKIERGAEIVHT